MTLQPELSGDELLAAELALGLLEGAPLDAAKARLDKDPAFASAVAEWEEHLAPLLDEIADQEPDSALWGRIREALRADAAPASNVVQLRRRAALWKTYAAGITAVAAALALAVGLERTSEPTPAVAPAPAPILVATLESAEGPTKVVATWQSETHSLLVMPALLTPAAGHSHELWLIPAGGVPRSLGLVLTGAPQRISVPREWVRDVGETATFAISVEPAGGSPTGQPTGAVIASGQLRLI